MMVMIFLLSSSSGCLGLLQSREVMEDLRGPPETKSESVKYTHEHVFTSLIDPEEHENTTTFEVDESVSEIVIWRKVEITGSDVIEDVFGGCLENYSRYVRADLWAPNTGPGDSPAWSLDECKNLPANSVEILPPFEAGTWTLDIVARGGGTANSALQDQFEISITLTRTCTEYPLEDDCI